MPGTSSRIWISLVVLVLWGAATMFGAQWLGGGEEVALDELVQRGVGWQFVTAILILLVAIVAFKWKDIGFGKPHSILRVLWFPSIYLLLMVAGILYLGVPPLGAVLLVFVNTMMVGFSEEVMFRGVLFRASIERMPVWPAILLNMVLFGGVHAFNGFITGDFSAAFAQSAAAAMSGLVFMAILLRTGSIWPAIIYHGLWDFLLFVVGLASTANGGGAGDASPPAFAAYAPMLLNLPNFIFALILLRNIHRHPGFGR
ncbi:CPBP family intramembrane metalloprotease [Parahaliea maris]|uniref:CPBP family intramembrane metalloprotease n=1 Tax=Parahaliea maris TaxID=2716870 RepID=A0A5C8ZWH2_9GAMM|nr:CPBP family intramembrane glutamic endopeptidase [Parahaliea maris]TXS92104.1 CPBP family intramembrane metalloprotease [Parahaliea maris]